MPKPRNTQVSLDATPYYHCVSRCVRRAHLCGHDAVTGADYSYRHQWIEKKILRLANIFALDIFAYAVTSNQVHVVLNVDRDVAANWSINDVVRRWHALFKGTSLSRRYLRGDILRKPEMEALESQVDLWRDRLHDISWYMRCLNETIARKINQEDGYTGRFWAGRFKCNALPDEKALAACMADVELNPMRARAANTPELSGYTPVHRRIRHTTGGSRSAGLFPAIGKSR